MPASDFRFSATVRACALGACVLAFTGLVAVVGMRFARGGIPSEAGSRVAWLEEEVKGDPSEWKDLAFAYVNAQQYLKVPEAFRKAADFYRQQGDVNAAIQMERSAEKYLAEARIYIEKPTVRKEAEKYYTGAKFEPVYGSYLGAFIENEDMITDRYVDEQGYKRPRVAAWDKAVGVKHAIFFRYLGYGRPFPMKWAEDLRNHKAAGQIAFEPTSLAQVKDDSYLRGFARAAKASGIPIFLRFASEMNGNWTPYHGNPALYIEKWRLVTRVMREEAPNVAMLWNVFETPITKVEEYYPGAEWVDWVGVNVYSVPYFNNNPNQKADWRNAADGVKFVYDKYSAKHPIMVAEYAASHLSSLDNVYRGEMARIKLSQFYASLPRLYPRIKAVCWLSMNAIAHAIPGRQKNNYSLLYDPPKAQRYKEMVSNPYFFNDLVLGQEPAMSPVFFQQLASSAGLSFPMKLSAWARSWENVPEVVWMADGKPVNRMREVGTYGFQLERAGSVGVKVLDSKGKVAAGVTVALGPVTQNP